MPLNCTAVNKSYTEIPLQQAFGISIERIRHVARHRREDRHWDTLGGLQIDVYG